LETERKYSYISEIIPHPNFNKTSYENDIALLKLSTPFDTSSSDGYINTVCIPNRGQSFTGIATASGWGNAESSPDSGELMAVDLPLISFEQCRGSKYKYSETIKYTMICAGYRMGGKDTCNGDSGGPLVQKVNNKSILVGIVSWGYGCAKRKYPGVYTNVSYYIDWIHSTLHFEDSFNQTINENSNFTKILHQLKEKIADLDKRFEKSLDYLTETRERLKKSEEKNTDLDERL